MGSSDETSDDEASTDAAAIDAINQLRMYVQRARSGQEPHLTSSSNAFSSPSVASPATDISLLSGHDVAAAPTGDSSPKTSDGHTIVDLAGMAGVRAALKALHLSNYTAAFEDAGYDDLDFLLALSPARRAELAKAAGMSELDCTRFADWLHSSVGAIAMTTV
jgi:hypothetical protein